MVTPRHLVRAHTAALLFVALAAGCDAGPSTSPNSIPATQSTAPSTETAYWAQLADALDAQGSAWWTAPPGPATIGTAGAAAVHDGATPPPAPIPAVAPESFDDLLLKTGLPYAFLNLRLHEDGAEWMATTRTAAPLNYGAFTASWPDVFDGFFFTAQMAPATRAP